MIECLERSGAKDVAHALNLILSSDFASEAYPVSERLGDIDLLLRAIDEGQRLTWSDVCEQFAEIQVAMGQLS
jgi:hypothetical protein